MALTAMQTVRFAFEWATSGTLLLATALFLPIARRIVAALPQWRRLTARQTGALAAAPFFAIPAGVFPPVWATGVLGQHRTVGVAYSAFLILWFVAVIALEARGVWPVMTDRAPRGLAIALTVALAGAIAFTGNGYTATSDLATGRLRQFDAAMSNRYAALERCRQRGVERCAIAPLPDLPASLYVLDISDNPSHWINEGYALFFGVKQVGR
jgi:hypothetical protein